MNALLRTSLKIPQHIRPDVVEVVERTSGQIQFREVDLRYLFDVYNRYMGDDPQRITCSACINRVVSRLRAVVTLWRQSNIDESGQLQIGES